jgi:hypothetical protein
MFKKTILSLLALTILTSVSYCTSDLVGPGKDITSFEVDRDVVRWPFHCSKSDGTKIEFFQVLKKYFYKEDKEIDYNFIEKCCNPNPAKCGNPMNPQGAHVIHYASVFGDKKLITYFTNNGSPMDAYMGRKVYTALMLVAKNGHKDALKLAIFGVKKSAQGNPLTQNSRGQTTRDVAEEAGQTAIVKYLDEEVLPLPLFSNPLAINKAHNDAVRWNVQTILKDSFEEERKTGKLADAIKGSDIFKIFERWMSTNGNKAFSRT